MICPKCELIAPSNYSLCPKCRIQLVKEKFAPQIEEVEEVEPISAFAVDGDIDDFES